MPTALLKPGGGKALLIDFNYTHETSGGNLPVPGVGPLPSIKESRMNHMGKLAFRWIYWNVLLKEHTFRFCNQWAKSGKHYETKETV